MRKYLLYDIWDVKPALVVSNMRTLPSPHVMGKCRQNFMQTTNRRTGFLSIEQIKLGRININPDRSEGCLSEKYNKIQDVQMSGRRRIVREGG